jgi:hypothetical protein
MIMRLKFDIKDIGYRLEQTKIGDKEALGTPEK